MVCSCADKIFFLDKVRQYTDILGSLIVDSIWRFKGKSFLVLSAGFLGVTFQIQAIAVIFYYAKAIEKGNVVSLLGQRIDTRSSILFLILIGLGIWISLLISALLVYISRTGILKLMRRYEEFCAIRIFSLFNESIKVLTADKIHNDSTILRLDPCFLSLYNDSSIISFKEKNSLP